MIVGRIFNVLRRVSGKDVNARLLGQVVNGELVVWWERLKAYLDAFRAISIATHAKVICAVGKDLIAKRMIKLFGKKEFKSVPATEIEVDRGIYESVEANPESFDATEAKAVKGIKILSSKGLVAYKRAAVFYVYKILICRKAKNIAAKAKLAEYRKSFIIKYKSEAEAASAELSKINRGFIVMSEADSCHALTKDMNETTIIPVAVSCAAVHAPPKEISTDNTIWTNVSGVINYVPADAITINNMVLTAVSSKAKDALGETLSKTMLERTVNKASMRIAVIRWIDPVLENNVVGITQSKKVVPDGNIIKIY